jgi:hypothetical protein
MAKVTQPINQNRLHLSLAGDLPCHFSNGARTLEVQSEG